MLINTSMRSATSPIRLFNWWSAHTRCLVWPFYQSGFMLATYHTMVVRNSLRRRSDRLRSLSVGLQATRAEPTER